MVNAFVPVVAQQDTYEISFNVGIKRLGNEPAYIEIPIIFEHISIPIDNFTDVSLSNKVGCGIGSNIETVQHHGL